MRPLGITLAGSRSLQVIDENGAVVMTLCRGLGNDIIISFDVEVPVRLQTEIWQNDKGPYPVVTAEF